MKRKTQKEEIKAASTCGEEAAEKSEKKPERKEKKSLKKRAGKTLRKAAAIGTAGAVLLALLIPAGLDALDARDAYGEELLNPPAVTMDIDSIDDADAAEEDAGEEQEEKKLGIFKRLKLALIGFFGAIGAWIATKIPWKKIFNKRNFKIAIVLLILGLLVYYGLPRVWEDCPWG